MRAAVAGERPVQMYSIGKESSVVLYLARKALDPAPLPFSLLQVDTGTKLNVTYARRDRMVRETGARLIVHRNEVAHAAGINPFTHGASYYADVMKTEELKQALDAHGFDVIFGGARRDAPARTRMESLAAAMAAGHIDVSGRACRAIKKHRNVCAKFVTVTPNDRTPVANPDHEGQWSLFVTDPVS